jgi:DNA-binding PadR family transcriptional regulator
MPRSPTEFLPFKPDLLLILLAVDAEPRHGYAIIKEVDRRTAGSMLLQTGALYRSLKGLLAEHLIEESDAPPGEPTGDERRRYYRTTRLGAAVIEAELERMAALVKSANAERARANAQKRPRLA